MWTWWTEPVNEVPREVWTVLYFPLIRLLGLPRVDIHIYTGGGYTGVTLRVHITQTSKNNTNRASPPGIRNQQREGGRGGSTREEMEEGR